jgi:uncharacterized protein YjbI with pentapeptide repeats
MAEESHLLLLKQGIEAWTRWRKQQADRRPDLSNASLRSLDLAKFDLAGADLRGADLRVAILAGASLAGADLTGANLFKAVLDGAELSRARLTAVQFLNCAQLVSARNWQAAFREPELACGGSLPPESG